MNEDQRQYELVCIVPPQLEGDGLENIKKEIETLINQNSGLIKFKEERKHDLAYPINKQGQGIYLISEISIAPEKISNISKELKLNKQILRHLISQLSPVKPKIEKIRKKPAASRSGKQAGPPKSEGLDGKPKPKSAVAKKKEEKKEGKVKLEEIDQKLDEIIKEI